MAAHLARIRLPSVHRSLIAASGIDWSCFRLRGLDRMGFLFRGFFHRPDAFLNRNCLDRRLLISTGLGCAFSRLLRLAASASSAPPATASSHCKLLARTPVANPGIAIFAEGTIGGWFGLHRIVRWSCFQALRTELFGFLAGIVGWNLTVHTAHDIGDMLERRSR